MTKLIASYVFTAFVFFVLGFQSGWTLHDIDASYTAEFHQSVCGSNSRYIGYRAHDPDTGERMCFQKSKASGRIESVSLVVSGL